VKKLTVILIAALAFACAKNPYNDLGGYSVISNEPCYIRYMDRNEKWQDTVSVNFKIEFKRDFGQMLKIKVNTLGSSQQELFVGIYEDRKCIKYKQGRGGNKYYEIRN